MGGEPPLLDNSERPKTPCWVAPFDLLTFHANVRNMKVVARLSSKGQITVPKTVRRTLGLNRGDGVEFSVEKGQVQMRAAKPSRSSSGILRRYLPPGWKAPTAEEMDAGIARHFARKHRGR
jgi:antitoxin PrlF